MDFDLAELKRLAGITDATGYSVYTEPVDRSAEMRENNIKPGTKEWFDLWFPVNPNRFPTGFRGRKK